MLLCNLQQNAQGHHSSLPIWKDITKKWDYRCSCVGIGWLCVCWQEDGPEFARMEIPEHNGIGSEADSLMNCIKLIPTAPQKDFIKFIYKDGKVLTFTCKMVEDKDHKLHPVDKTRMMIFQVRTFTWTLKQTSLHQGNVLWVHGIDVVCGGIWATVLHGGWRGTSVRAASSKLRVRFWKIHPKNPSATKARHTKSLLP